MNKDSIKIITINNYLNFNIIIDLSHLASLNRYALTERLSESYIVIWVVIDSANDIFDKYV